MAGNAQKRTLVLAGAALGLVLVGVVAARLLTSPPPAPPAGPDAALAPPPAGPDAAQMAAPVPPAPAAQEAVVASVSGAVERQRGANWTPVSVGDRVFAEDSLRTGAAGRAELEIGPGGRDPGEPPATGASRITVAEDTQVKVAELTAAVHRFRIKRGRVAAAYQPDGERVLRIEGESGSAVAEARAAQFSVRVSETTFAVATETGVVNLRSAGNTVPVGQGQVSVAREGAPPSPAGPIPAQVLLKVAAAARGNPCETVEGTGDPGSQVSVGDVEAQLDAEGRFRASVDPRGAKEIRVVLRDVLGRTREERVVCATAPATPPVPPGPERPIDNLKIRWGE